jgi:hypothetical protein
MIGSLNLSRSPVSALPPDLLVGGDLNLSDTRIAALPPDLHVGGNLDLSGNRISAEAVRRILTMPNLSREARITGLDTAGYPSLAIQARRQPDGQAGPGTPPTP